MPARLCSSPTLRADAWRWQPPAAAPPAAAPPAAEPKATPKLYAKKGPTPAELEQIYARATPDQQTIQFYQSLGKSPQVRGPAHVC